MRRPSFRYRLKSLSKVNTWLLWSSSLILTKHASANDMGTEQYFASNFLTGWMFSSNRKDIEMILRWINRITESLPVLVPASRKQASETTASHVRMGGAIWPHCALAHLWNLSLRFKNATRGPVSNKMLCFIDRILRDAFYCAKGLWALPRCRQDPWPNPGMNWQWWPNSMWQYARWRYGLNLICSPLSFSQQPPILSPILQALLR